jgi:threonine dehydrogenase-like Zn-dependent dehydrogenase
VVLAAGKAAANFSTEALVRKEISLQGAYGVGARQYERAIAMIAHGHIAFDRLQTHLVPLEQLDHAIDLLAGTVDGEQAINVVVDTA